MKRITGVTVNAQGELIMVESDIFRCRCIKDMVYMEPTTIGSFTYSKYPIAKSWISGKVYDYSIDRLSSSQVINPYVVFITEHDTNNITKEVFDEHFIDIEEYRDNQIDDLTHGLR
jgi:hypothetical protein